MQTIDLRSDTVTKPTPAMRRAMAEAEVGDDVYGEDPTVRALEERVAALLGKEAALFVPSGTMANQLALMIHTRHGDEVVIGEGTHCAWFESGAASALSGVQFSVAGEGGLFDAEALYQAVKAPAYYLPRTSLVVIENTHNRGGGRVFPQELVGAVATRARELGLGVHIDGARLWNASAATGLALDVLAAPADTVSVCFSKGLGAPVGSALVGGRDVIAEALRRRRMLGGAMRQCGILAAAALYGIEHHRARLATDHRHAKLFAQIVAGAPGVELDATRVETNIVNVGLTRASEAEVLDAARERGVLLGSIAPRTLRAVTHGDVDEASVRLAAERLAAAIAATTSGERAD